LNAVGADIDADAVSVESKDAEAERLGGDRKGTGKGFAGVVYDADQSAIAADILRLGIRYRGACDSTARTDRDDEAAVGIRAGRRRADRRGFRLRLAQRKKDAGKKYN
jgi:hypothetical protein